jgi:hypothetical protein
MREEEDKTEWLSQKMLQEMWKLISSQEEEIHELKQKIVDIRYGSLMD